MPFRLLGGKLCAVTRAFMLCCAQQLEMQNNGQSRNYSRQGEIKCKLSHAVVACAVVARLGGCKRGRAGTAGGAGGRGSSQASACWRDHPCSAAVPLLPANNIPVCQESNFRFLTRI